MLSNTTLTDLFQYIFEEGKCSICGSLISTKPPVQCVGPPTKSKTKKVYKDFSIEIQKHVYHLLSHRDALLDKFDEEDLNNLYDIIRDNDNRITSAVDFLEEDDVNIFSI